LKLVRTWFATSIVVFIAFVLQVSFDSVSSERFVYEKVGTLERELRGAGFSVAPEISGTSGVCGSKDTLRSESSFTF
jgi:hypothetical protein